MDTPLDHDWETRSGPTSGGEGEGEGEGEGGPQASIGRSSGGDRVSRTESAGGRPHCEEEEASALAQSGFEAATGSGARTAGRKLPH